MLCVYVVSSRYYVTYSTVNAFIDNLQTVVYDEIG